MSPKNFGLLFAFVLLLITVLVIVSVIRRKKREEEINQIQDMIDLGVGAEGDDFAKLLYNVQPDLSYTGAAMQAKSIKGAKGIFNDKEEDVYSALAGKTKAQIKTIQQIFEKTYGSLDEHLKSFLSDSEYSKALNFVKTAR